MQKHLLSNCEAVEALKEEYDELYSTDLSHAGWRKKRISNAVQFEGGLIYEFEKPGIKKDFCFGAGMYACCTVKEQEQASDMVQKSRTDAEYFIKENFDEAWDGLERLFLDMFQGSWQCRGLHAKPSHYSKEIKRCYLVSEKTLLCRDEDSSSYYKLTDLDIENLKKTIEEEKAKFLKRLNTYLKKYGLTKVNSWSYIRD